jgi:hypothetical protein
VARSQTSSSGWKFSLSGTVAGTTGTGPSGGGTGSASATAECGRDPYLAAKWCPLVPPVEVQWG